MPISKELKNKIEFYEKYYFALDDPVPFKDDLKIYPIRVQNYYDFYSFMPFLNIDKNIKKEKYMDKDAFGHDVEKIREVSNLEGMKMSNMAWLVNLMRDPETGPTLTAQVVALLELCLHEKNGLFCPNCGHHAHKDTNNVFGWEHQYKDDIDESTLKRDDEGNIDYTRLSGDDLDKKTIITFDEIFASMKGLSQEERAQKFRELLVCPVCGSERREIYSITGEGQTGKLCIYNNNLSSQDYEELKAVILHYNILNYDGDEYVDPDLKADLDKKARLQNKDYQSPTLEKQLVCISISSPYTFDELRNVTLRKMSYLLKMVDVKENYFCQIQGAYSGMVKFKKDPEHWIFGNNGRDINKEITMVDDFARKFKGFV